MALAERTETVASRSLDELAEVVSREYAMTIHHAESALAHALACGEALLEAREACPPGEWVGWLDENFQGGRVTAQKIMRLAAYRDRIPQGVTSKTTAERMLRFLPRTTGIIGEADEGTKRRAVRVYRRGGKTLEEVGQEFGVSASTVHNWVTREDKAKNSAEAAEALRRQKRDRGMRKVGGAVSESYSLMRRTAQALDRAAGEVKDREVRAAVNAALAKLHEAEDELVRAVGLS